jgi:GxxExxY protein
MKEQFEPDYTHRDLTQKIIGVYYSVYNELGYGFLESVYQEAMFIALRDAGLSVKREVPVEVSSAESKSVISSATSSPMTPF